MSRRLGLGTLVVGCAVALAPLAGCGGGGSDPQGALAVAAPATDIAVTPPSTTTVPPTVASTTVAATAPTPTTVPPPPPPPPPPPTQPSLPVPVEPPPEDGSDEPRVEVGSIEIPRVGLAAPMLEGIRLSTLDQGPGHWPGTAMPGELGNVVIAGHRVSNNAEFRHLDQLQPGDEVVFNTATGRHVYLVSRTEIVAPDAVWIVSQTVDHTATLFACHPPGSVRQRIVVHLQLAA